MRDIKEIKIQEFHYDLPEGKIARYPLDERDISKLLIFRGNKIDQDRFSNIYDYLDKDSLLVFNNTRVIRARLRFLKSTGATIEIFCLDPSDPSDYMISFASRDYVEWNCMIGNLKKWKVAVLEMSLSINDESVCLRAEKLSQDKEVCRVRFSWDSKNITFGEILDAVGHVPVPPYLHRDDELIDHARYQTVYSKYNGSVAAPTAGLHFTESVLRTLSNKGIDRVEITLHVGAGTFIPVKSEEIGDHEMHTEHLMVTRSSLKKLNSEKIIAVGTTSVRTLESLYWLGVKARNNMIRKTEDLYIDQWEPYEMSSDIDFKDAISALEEYMDKNQLEIFHADSRIIILPGYNFRIVKGLITNYHMPGSTLLLLVAALIGKSWKDVYSYALENDFRFLSYGDSSLLLP